jgi:hypothetical protein
VALEQESKLYGFPNWQAIDFLRAIAALPSWKSITIIGIWCESSAFADRNYVYSFSENFLPKIGQSVLGCAVGQFPIGL